MEIIHIVLGKANPNRMNGVNKVVFQLAEHQAKAGKKVSIWGISKDLSHNYPDRNFTTRLFKAHRNLFKVDETLVQAIEKVKNREVVFHIHGGWIPTFCTLSRYLAKNKLRFVFTPHGAYNTVARLKSRYAKGVYFPLFERPLLKRAAAIHCIGGSEVSGLNEIYSTTKTQLIPYGFESNAGLISLQNPKKGTFIIGFLGRLDIHTKGLDLLLGAFAQFTQKVDNAQLWIIGDSDQRSQLEGAIADLNLDDKVVLWGKKFGQQKLDLLHQMDVFAHPSRNEGLPSSVLEAADLGVPCLITEATNVGPWIQSYKSGLVVENENVEALTDGLSVLFQKWQSGDFDEMRSAAHLMVQEAFNWETIVASFDALYTPKKAV
jgi:glycosyltransferase involved in cell wall biosynthesis